MRWFSAMAVESALNPIYALDAIIARKLARLVLYSGTIMRINRRSVSIVVTVLLSVHME
jgi:hypothetical protein